MYAGSFGGQLWHVGSYGCTWVHSCSVARLLHTMVRGGSCAASHAALCSANQHQFLVQGCPPHCTPPPCALSTPLSACLSHAVPLTCPPACPFLLCASTLSQPAQSPLPIPSTLNPDRSSPMGYLQPCTPALALHFCVPPLTPLSYPLTHILTPTPTTPHTHLKTPHTHLTLTPHLPAGSP